MKSNRDNKYSEISSFKDFRFEREQLNFKSSLIKAKLKLNYLQVSERFTVSNLVTSLAKGIILPKISDLFGNLIKQVGKKDHPEPDKNKEV